MTYQVKAIQTIIKHIEIEADNESDAMEKVQTMAEEGEIHFDDEPFLDMDVTVQIVSWHPYTSCLIPWARIRYAHRLYETTTETYTLTPIP